MATKKDPRQKSDKGPEARLAALATQGRTWKFTEEVSKFKRPGIILDPPLEITPSMLHGLRMVDEIGVVIQRHGLTADSPIKVEREV